MLLTGGHCCLGELFRVLLSMERIQLTEVGSVGNCLEREERDLMWVVAPLWDVFVGVQGGKRKTGKSKILLRVEKERKREFSIAIRNQWKGKFNKNY